MANSILLTGRPLDETFYPTPASLTITGVLPGYSPGEAFEGRLQLANYVGDCTAKFLDGTDAPAGLLISVDNDTHEIVLTWDVPPNEYTTVIPNGDFESTGGWTWNSGNGWTHDFGYGNESASSARFVHFNGESHMVHSLRPPVEPGATIRIQVDVQQGASSSGNVLAGPLLQWYDDNGVALEPTLGRAVNSGSHGRWGQTVLVAAAPADAAFVSPGFYGWRGRQDKELHVDNVVWDYTYQSGGLDPDAEYPLVIQATDSANHTAVWRGVLTQQYVELTSRPYRVPSVEGITETAHTTAVLVAVPPTTSWLERVANTASVTGLQIVTQGTPSIVLVPEQVQNGAHVTALEVRDLVRAASAGVESTANTAQVSGLEVRTLVISTAAPAESVKQTANVTELLVS